MDDLFEVAFQHILKVEGGLSDNPNDPGGITNMGISLRAYPDLGRDGIINLTIEKAREIYYEDYWLPLDPNELDSRLAIMAFDSAVNHGLSRTLRWLADHPDFEGFLTYRLRFYTRLSTWKHFGKGWVNRVASVLEVISNLENPIIKASRLYIKRSPRMGFTDPTWDVIELDPSKPARVVGDKLYANEQ